MGMLIILSALRKGPSTGQDASTSPRRSTSRNRRASGSTTSAPAARAAAAMPLRAKHDRASLMLTSVTIARRAPASRQSRTASATTSGFVLAACSTVRSQAALGLMTTTSPREMKRRMPPSSWIARRTMRAGSSHWTTTISGRARSAGTSNFKRTFSAAGAAGCWPRPFSHTPSPAAAAPTPPKRSSWIIASRRRAGVASGSMAGAPLTSRPGTSNCGGVKAAFGVRAVLTLIGFTAASAQIVLLRELMVVFYGNESSIGLMLGSWLFWTAAGSSLAGRFAARARQPRRLIAGIQVLIAAILPWTILAVCAAKGVLQTVPGEVLGPGPLLLTAFSTLGPLCILSGALFTAGSQVYAAAVAASAGEATGSVYLDRKSTRLNSSHLVISDA